MDGSLVIKNFLRECLLPTATLVIVATVWAMARRSELRSIEVKASKPIAGIHRAFVVDECDADIECGQQAGQISKDSDPALTQQIRPARIAAGDAD